MHRFSFYGQVIDSTDETEIKPLAVYPAITDHYSTEAADPQQALELYYLEGPGANWTPDMERKLMENMGLDYLAVLLRDTDEDVIYFGHVHVEWNGQEFVRHF